MNTNLVLALHTCLRPRIWQWLAFTIFLTGSGTAVTQEVGPASEFNDTYAVYQSLVAEEKYAEAIPHARRALELGHQIYGEHDRNTVALMQNLGTCLRRSGHPDEAVPFLTEAITRYEIMSGRNARELVDPLTELGHALAQGSESREYRRHYTRALDIIERHEGRDSLLYGDVAMEAGAVMVFRALDNDGRRHLRNAYDIFKRRLGPGDRRTGMSAFYYGKYFMTFNMAGRAEAMLMQALQAFETNPADEMLATTHAFLVELYDSRGNASAAAEHSLAIGRLMSAAGVESPRLLIEHEPDYPQAARRTQAEGFVELEFTVDASGKVNEPKILAQEGHTEFAAAALTAIDRFRYAPRYVDGQFIPTDGVRYRFTFSPTRISRRERCHGIISAMNAAAKATARVHITGVHVGPVVPQYPPYCM